MTGNFVVKKNMPVEGKWNVAVIKDGWVVPFASFKREKIAVGVCWILNKIDGK